MVRRNNVTTLIIFLAAFVVIPRYAFGGAPPIVVTSESLKQLYKDHINNVVMVKSELKDFQKQSQEKKNDNDCDDDNSFLKTGAGAMILLPHFYTTDVNKRAQGMRPYGIGTGFVWAVRGTDVYIATNHHVVENTVSVTVLFQEKEYAAQIIGSDPLRDAALLKVIKKENSDPFKPVMLGDSRTVSPGELTMSIGSLQGLAFSLSFGSIAQLRPFTDSPMIGFQLDQATYPGDSGSPLYNYQGEVIGVEFAIIQGTDRGLAIPINEFNEKITMWLNKELGISK